MPAPVGVQCRECVSEANAELPHPVTNRVRNVFRPRGSTPVVTYSLIGLCVVVYGLQWLLGSSFTSLIVYYAPFTVSQPWRWLTSMFAHSPTNPLHLILNMYTLYLFGPVIESLVGRLRFLVLYLVSGYAATVAVLFLAPSAPVLGASGAIFGLMGAYFVIARHLGGNQTQIIVVIAINLGFGFLVPGISWQAHVGGVLAGVAVAAVYVATRRRAQRTAQILGVVGIVVALLVLTAVGILLLSSGGQ